MHTKPESYYKGLPTIETAKMTNTKTSTRSMNVNLAFQTSKFESELLDNVQTQNYSEVTIDKQTGTVKVEEINHFRSAIPKNHFILQEKHPQKNILCRFYKDPENKVR